VLSQQPPPHVATPVGQQTPRAESAHSSPAPQQVGPHGTVFCGQHEVPLQAETVRSQQIPPQMSS